MEAGEGGWLGPEWGPGAHSSFVRDFISLGLLTETGSWVQDFEPQLFTIFLRRLQFMSPMIIAECRSLNFHTNVIITVHLATVGHKIPAESKKKFQQNL